MVSGAHIFTNILRERYIRPKCFIDFSYGTRICAVYLYGKLHRTIIACLFSVHIFMTFTCLHACSPTAIVMLFVSYILGGYTYSLASYRAAHWFYKNTLIKMSKICTRCIVFKQFYLLWRTNDFISEKPNSQISVYK